jgi:hypothetical protein
MKMYVNQFLQPRIAALSPLDSVRLLAEGGLRWEDNSFKNKL